MVLRSFADGRVWMNTCRMVELSGIVVASTAGLARSTHQYQLWRWVGGRRRRRPVRRTGLDPVPATAPEHTEDEVPEQAAVVTASEEINIHQEVAPPQKSAIIHDFCLGIPFGGLLFSMGLVGFLFWRSPVSLTFGVAPGLAILGLAVLSLKGWRSGKSSLPFILAQAAVAAAVAWKHCQAYTTTKKLLPWGFYTALSALMICFYSYVLLAGGNPPPKKKPAAAI
ncbi:hypothetical protein D1007_49679 [Hordeum vulgare]|nr:hypothetical protein D1007_49679 [Hordeum vulgare]